MDLRNAYIALRSNYSGGSYLSDRNISSSTNISMSSATNNMIGGCECDRFSLCATHGGGHHKAGTSGTANADEPLDSDSDSSHSDSDSDSSHSDSDSDSLYSDSDESTESTDSDSDNSAELKSHDPDEFFVIKTRSRIPETQDKMNKFKMLKSDELELDDLKKKHVEPVELDDLSEIDDLRELEKLEKKKINKLDGLDEFEELDKLDKLDKQKKSDKQDKLDKLDKFDELDELNNLESNHEGGAPNPAPSSGSAKWKTLEHNGVMFHPPYEPHSIPIKYMNELIELNPEAEEFVTYFVSPRFDKYKNKRFESNFFKGWRELLLPDLRKKIKDFSLVDLSEIKSHVLAELERKKDENKSKTKEQRDKEKLERADNIEKYSTAIVDGVIQNIDNYIVEPPTIFVGRGDHPLSGSIKRRLGPEDITLNVGPNMPIPVAVVGDDMSRVWGEIICDPTLEWIASWNNNVTDKYNYARFGRKSSFKMKSDESKYELARLLKRKIKKIRDKNEYYMTTDIPEYRQLATALFLIDRLALRIGNEKREDEADTVGVTTLKNSNIALLDSNVMKLDFLGKDSIRYVNKFEVPPTVYSNIREFMKSDDDNNKPKTPESNVFHLITAESLNKYIRSFMKKLTSKVFRTYNASYLMQIELRKISKNFKDYDKPDKVSALKHLYDMSNLKVAKLCNHQRATTTGNTKQLEKTNEQIQKLKLNINKLKRDKKKKQDEGKAITAINKNIASKQKKIKLLNNKKKLQTESKTLSAGTSKINYIDPRITISFLKQNNVMDSIDKFFNKSHQKLFEWAMDIDEDFTF